MDGSDFERRLSGLMRQATPDDADAAGAVADAIARQARRRQARRGAVLWLSGAAGAGAALTVFAGAARNAELRAFAGTVWARLDSGAEAAGALAPLALAALLALAVAGVQALRES